VRKESAPPESVARWFNGATGAPTTEEAAASAGASADAIIIGENHGHPLGLSTAADLWDEVLKRTDHAALALEFFERDDQSRVDDYLAGLIDEKAFKTKTGRTESSYPSGHRRMVEAAKAAGRPVIASNAPRAQVRAAGKDGYDKLAKLTSEQRRLVRIPDDLPTGKYREDFERVMSEPNAAHGPKPKDEAERKKQIESAFRGQSLWDWTMADSVASAIGGGSRPVCQVVGRFHEDFRGGLVQALEKLRPGVKAVTISFVDAWSDSLRDEDKGRAEFVVYVGPEPASH
jgi:uncharacterized iron-regulated protein